MSSTLLLLGAAGAGLYFLGRKKTDANAVTAKSGKTWIVETVPKGSSMDLYFQLPADTHAYQLSAPAGSFGPHNQIAVLYYTQKGADISSRRVIQKTTGLPEAMATTAISDFGLKES